MTVVSAFFLAARAGDGAEVDASILERCTAGDPAALRVFVLRYQHMVFAYLSRALGAGPHVEDLAQDVFIRACQGLPSFDAAGPARLSTWVLTIANRVAIDARRKRRLATTELSPDAAQDAATPETERHRSEVGLALQRAADALPDEQRDVFILAELYELSMKEISVVLGIRENTVKTRLFRARERLRVLLQGLWEERP
jgi:RNA polymerase sigma-70 factor (ECF subfamily)